MRPRVPQGQERKRRDYHDGPATQLARLRELLLERAAFCFAASAPFFTASAPFLATPFTPSAAERWRSIKVTEFEHRQITAVRKELDQEYEAQVGLKTQLSKDVAR